MHGWVGESDAHVPLKTFFACCFISVESTCVTSPAGEGMTEGEAPRLLTAMLSKAGPTGDLECFPKMFFCFFKDAVKVKQTNLLFSTPFDAIADFARRTTGGGGRSRRDDSRDRDLRFVLYASLLLDLHFAQSSVVMICHCAQQDSWALLCSFYLF